jgi:hypothetical protein
MNVKQEQSRHLLERHDRLVGELATIQQRNVADDATRSTLLVVDAPLGRVVILVPCCSCNRRNGMILRRNYIVINVK